jgi:Flp pilus assembly protein TadG
MKDSVLAIATCKHKPQETRNSRFFTRPSCHYTKSKLKPQNGATLVECAIAVPLFLLLIFGILQFGWLLNNYVLLNNAALLGARELAKKRGYTSPLPYTAINNRIRSSVVTMKQNLTVTMTVGGQACDTSSCAGLGTFTSPPPLNTQATVSLSYTFIPIIPGLTKLSALQLNASSSEFVQ